MVITGKGTMFDGPTPIRMKDITDGDSNTIMIGEMSFSGIYWSDPRDLNFDEMPLTINDSVQVSLRSVHRGMANIAFADGSVHQISEKIDPEVLKSLITVAGGEQIQCVYVFSTSAPPSASPHRVTLLVEVRISCDNSSADGTGELSGSHHVYRDRGRIATPFRLPAKLHSPADRVPNGLGDADSRRQQCAEAARRRELCGKL